MTRIAIGIAVLVLVAAACSDTETTGGEPAVSRVETGPSAGEAAVSRIETSSPLLSSDPASLFGSAGTIDDALRPALEDALNVELNLDDTFEMTPAGGYTVVFNYVIEGDPPSDPVAAFAEAVGSLGGTATLSETRGGVVSVNSQGISIGDVAFFVGLTLKGKELGAVVSKTFHRLLCSTGTQL